MESRGLILHFQIDFKFNISNLFTTDWLEHLFCNLIINNWNSSNQGNNLTCRERNVMVKPEREGDVTLIFLKLRELLIFNGKAITTCRRWHGKNWISNASTICEGQSHPPLKMAGPMYRDSDQIMLSANPYYDCAHTEFATNSITSNNSGCLCRCRNVPAYERHVWSVTRRGKDFPIHSIAFPHLVAQPAGKL